VFSLVIVFVLVLASVWLMSPSATKLSLMFEREMLIVLVVWGAVTSPSPEVISELTELSLLTDSVSVLTTSPPAEMLPLIPYCFTALDCAVALLEEI
jgi:hypothetical protein